MQFKQEIEEKEGICANCQTDSSPLPPDSYHKSSVKPRTIVIAVLVLGAMIIAVVQLSKEYFIFHPIHDARTLEHFDRVAFSKATVLGQYLAHKYPGQKLLVICYPGFKQNPRTREVIDILKQSVGIEVESDTIKVKIEKDMLDKNGKLIMPLEEIITAKAFDATVSAHPTCSIIVSIIGLPHDKKKFKFWHAKNKHLVMFNTNIYKLEKEIKEGRIAAAVSYRPGPIGCEDPVPSDPLKFFDRFFILITPENISEIKKKYPKRFK